MQSQSILLGISCDKEVESVPFFVVAMLATMFDIADQAQGCV